MAECPRIKVEKQLNCGICLGDLKNPKALQCLHIFCFECIMTLDMTGNKLTCPGCQATMKVRCVFKKPLKYLTKSKT